MTTKKCLKPVTSTSILRKQKVKKKSKQSEQNKLNNEDGYQMKWRAGKLEQSKCNQHISLLFKKIKNIINDNHQEK
jgi:hypothetical protein